MMIITEDEYRRMPEEVRGICAENEHPGLEGRRTLLTTGDGKEARLIEGEDLIILRGRYLGESAEQPPLPGHFVIITENDDPHAPAGTLGVIEGIVGQFSEHYLVCFNPQPVPLKDDRLCSATGSPTYRIRAHELVFTKRTTSQMFRRRRPGSSCRELGEKYIDEVFLFELKTSFEKRRAGA
ncbi:MAG: hypothetical protein AB1805_01250 [Nitrospirota bacterium]